MRFCTGASSFKLTGNSNFPVESLDILCVQAGSCQFSGERPEDRQPDRRRKTVYKAITTESIETFVARDSQQKRRTVRCCFVFRPGRVGPANNTWAMITNNMTLMRSMSRATKVSVLSVVIGFFAPPASTVNPYGRVPRIE